mmetsp:Transcript_33773/g.70995  ORF Transcript_33773/g.70995 Transcript_33773/m.70995 type:complete len:603 (-) Transcript_33773:953-2761(-)
MATTEPMTATTMPASPTTLVHRMHSKERTKVQFANDTDTTLLSSDSVANIDGDMPGYVHGGPDQDERSNDKLSAQSDDVLYDERGNSFISQSFCSDGLPADDDDSAGSSEAQSESTSGILMRYVGNGCKAKRVPKPKQKPKPKPNPKPEDSEQKKQFDGVPDDASVASESSYNVLMRYMGCSSEPYLKRRNRKGSKTGGTNETEIQYKHDLREGDHVIRWKMLGYCYPIQVHGIVFSAGPDFVTIVDCGLASGNSADKAGNDFEEEYKKGVKKTRRKRMGILTLVDEKEIKKWTKIRYGEEVQLKVHSSNKEMQQKVNENGGLLDDGGEKKTSDMEAEESPSAGLEMEEVETCVQANIKQSPTKPTSRKSIKKSTSWFSWSGGSADNATPTEEVIETKSESAAEAKSKPKKQTLRLPNADPPILVLARLRFLLEYGEEPFPPPPSSADTEDDKSKDGEKRKNLLPPHHLLYANSECIAVYCKTGRWSTLQAAIFLHSSTVGNVKQTATLAMFLSAQTVTVPVSGFWGWFGGTTTISLFSAQPWLVPALVGGGMVYVGLPMVMLWKAKGRWADAEERLNNAFWSMYDTDVIVEMIRCWSGLED